MQLLRALMLLSRLRVSHVFTVGTAVIADRLRSLRTKGPLQDKVIAGLDCLWQAPTIPAADETLAKSRYCAVRLQYMPISSLAAQTAVVGLTV